MFKKACCIIVTVHCPLIDIMVFDTYPFHNQLIKGESLAANLISPSVSPSPSSASAVSLTLPVSVSRRKSISTSSSLAGPKRVRPYPRTNNSRKKDNMSTGYEWTHGARSTHGRSLPSSERRSLEGAYTQSSYIQDYNNVMGSSSLNGAMNMAADATTHSRQSRSPASSHSGSGYTGNLSSINDMTWHQNNTNIMISSSTASYPGVAGHGGSYPMTMDDSFSLTTAARNVSPKSLSSPSPSYAANHGHNGGHNAHSGSSMMYGPGSMGHYASTSTSDYQPQNQNQSQSDKELIRTLQARVRQLEEESQQQAQQKAKAAAYGNQTASGLPPALPSSQFQRQWKSRTDARTRIFCSLNRAGNALCSWHDSRRERRQYPPRNAPPGYLNCGCTFEEALFEESLARHKVGSYHPGDSVRMDPALRNPLLKLLVARYGYKDGDFDHDPLRETWDEGEDPVSWEQKAHSGAHMRRRNENAH